MTSQNARATQPAARWTIRAASAEAASTLSQALKIPRFVAAVLVNRGFTTPDLASQFLSPPLRSLHDPHLMLDMGSAVDRILRALTRNESILLYGDYDVDGTSSIVILKTALELLGGKVEFHVPHRITDGYGMRNEAVEDAAAHGITLIISVDTGIRAAEVVGRAWELNIDVIVTDHHLPDSKLPPALAVLNPNRPGCPYPEKNLCGAGVAFKLIQALLLKSPQFTVERREKLLDSFLKLVAIATIADIVPLTGENRVIVQRGLRGLRRVNNAGLRALLGVSGLQSGVSPSSHQIAFQIAPRINAAGRMASARDVVDLFLTNDENRARQLAEQLDSLNRERQTAEAEIVDAILAECEGMADLDTSAALIFAKSGWHLGVVGIVASRLVERFFRPVFVLSDSNEDGCFSGSGRSIPSFHLLEALESMSELFRKFGGHKQAAGLTIPCSQVEEFRSRFVAFANQRLSAADLRPEYFADAEASFPEFNTASVATLFELAPFGFGNPTPLFFASGVEVASPPRPLGKDAANPKHFKVALRQCGRTLMCNAWNFASRSQLLEPGSRLDILFTLEDDPGSRARGYDGWNLSLKDVRPPAIWPEV
jgi:single-stranded-DNA-specific exonuclease